MRLHLVVYAAVLAAGPAMAQPAAAPSPVPLSAFVQEDRFYNPRLAPDGKHIAITARVPSGDRFIPVLMMYSVPDMQMTVAIRFPVFEVPANYHWVSPTRLVVAKGREFGLREAPQATGEVVEHAHAMRAALSAAGRPPEWLLAPNEGHGFYDTANRTAFYEKLEAFLERNIGKGAVAGVRQSRQP